MGKTKSFDASLPLSSDRMEKFCQIMLTPNMQPSRAAFLAGYGQENGHTKQDTLHTIMGKRLINNPKVNARICYLRENLAREDQNFIKKIIENLKDIIMDNQAAYIESCTYKGKYNEDKTSFYWNKKLSEIPNHWKSTHIDYIDPRTNAPVMIKKSYAYDTLLEIYGLKKDNSILDDIQSVFQAAGLSLSGGDEQVDDGINEIVNGYMSDIDDEDDLDMPIE